MRVMFVATSAALLGVACAGDDDPGTQTALACDVLEAANLKTVNRNDWPDGVAQALSNYEDIGGLYSAESSCGNSNVKFEVGDVSQIDIITRPWPEDLECGCVEDPNFEADSMLNPVAIHRMPQGQKSLFVFVEKFDDPAVDGVTLTNGTVTAFQPTEPLQLRGCATRQVDPLAGSNYQFYTAIVRQPRGTSSLEFDVVLSDALDGAEDRICEFRNLKLIERTQ